MSCRRPLSIVAALWLAFVAVTTASAADWPVVFPIPAYPDFIIAPVTIGGVDHLCCVDSGLTGYMFHTSLRDKLGKSMREAKVSAANGEGFTIEVFPTPSARIGSIDLKKDVLTGSFDMSLTREMEGRDIEGMIGVPLFRSTIVQLDFDRGRLVLLPPSTQPEDDWGSSTDVMYVQGGVPLIRAALGDTISEQFIVDTGLTESLTLESDLYSTLIDDGSLRKIGDYTSAQANGIRTDRQARLSKLKVAGFENRDLLATDGGKHSRIGLKYLRRFKVTFDLSHDRIFFAKGAAFEKPDKKPMFGLATLRKGNKSLMARVWPDSPAEKAGILAGDELISVDGKPIQGKPVLDIIWLMTEKVEQSGSVDLIVSRDGKQQSVSIRIPQQDM